MKKRKGGSEQHTTEYKGSLRSSLILVMAAFSVLCALCIAWFVSNRAVSGLLGEVSASDQVQYVLASTGKRLDAEKNHLLMRQEGETLVWGDSLLTLGNWENYPSYIDTATGVSVPKEQIYYTQPGEFAWCFEESLSFYPGARGVLELYLIPRVSGLTKVELKLELTPYQAVKDGNGKTGAVVKEDETLAKLLRGHILLFHGLNDTTGYSGWLGEDYSVTVAAKDGETLVKDMPYQVRIYWIWPKQYRNLIYDKYSTRGDLFSNTRNNTDYTNLIQYVNSNKDHFFYGGTQAAAFPENTSDQMSQEEFERGVLTYNQADEYIGTNTDYLYIRVSTE